MKHYGDITKIKGNEVPIVDVVVGGSPCQDLSIANGNRTGLDGERSGLFMEQIRIVRELHNECRRTNKLIRPRYMVWENVTGVFSTNDGEDFRAVLEETARLADSDTVIPRLPTGQGWTNSGTIMGCNWSIAWRVHNSQFWGVPQSRRRLCLVADFRGQTAPEILFEQTSLFGNSEQSETGGQRNACSIGECPNDTSRTNSKLKIDEEQPTGALSFLERFGKEGGGKGILITNECVGAISTLRLHKVLDTRKDVFRKTAHPQNANEGQGWEPTETNDTLNVFDITEARTPTLVLEHHPQDSRIKIKEDGVVQTLPNRMGTGGGNVPLVMSNVAAVDCRHGTESDVRGTLQATAWKSLNNNNTVRTDKFVRRLTPLECERLQGFPDNWTEIGEWTDSKGKKHKSADSLRLRALGNSIALPFWEWMSARMIEHLKADGCEHPTMASLFDGIGGFPLVYSRNGCEPVWASEIEEFPIAVTKYHFPEERGADQ